MSTDENTAAQTNHIRTTAELVSAYVANNHVQPTELAALIVSVHAALHDLGKVDASVASTVTMPTAAQIRKSITPDALISFVDGKPYKILKRHLAGHGLGLAAYRERYGLPVDYPAVCVNYSEARSAIARSLGSGRKPTEAPDPVKITAPPPAPAAVPAAPKPRGRRKKAEAAA